MKRDYREILNEINELHAKYPKTVLGRKDIIKEIKEKIKEIRKMTSVCNAELDDLERYYAYREYYVNDYNVVMSLLLRLLNSEEENFSLKEVTTTGYYNTAGSEANKLFSKITFITQTSLCDKIDDHLYYFDEFKTLANKYINDGYSMIIITSNLFEPSVKPKKSDVICDSVYDIRNSGLKGNITCYCNGTIVKEAIDKLIDFINVNGPDFSNIDEDTLFEIINDSKNKQKKIVK